jgi:hypothetical protein
VYALHDGTVRGVPLRLVAANAPAAESDLTPMAPAELLAGTRRDAGEMADAAPAASPDATEKRQGLWRLVLAALAVLLVTEMIVANRGWRGSADRRTLDWSDRRDA